MHLRSSAFKDGEAIPEKYTSQGDDVSPPLAWDDVPAGTKSLALIVEDPDAMDPAKGTAMWIHWLVVDLPPESQGLPEATGVLPKGVVGLNDWERARWNGPARPTGRHHYVFKLYALDREVGLEKPTKYDFDRKLASSLVLAEAKLVGVYQREQAAGAA